MTKREVRWSAFWTWVVVGSLGLTLLVDELLGIAHVWGLNPITDDAENDPRIAALLALWFPVALAWWLVHLRNNRTTESANAIPPNKGYRVALVAAALAITFAAVVDEILILKGGK